MSDIKRRYQWYWQDIRDGFNIQIIASIIFIFFANVTHATTFGGVLFSFTEEHFVSLSVKLILAHTCILVQSMCVAINLAHESLLG